MAYWFELIATGLITGGIYAVVALGLNLQYGLMRIMNISHGEFLMLGAYLTWVGFTVLQVNPLLFLPVVALALFALGVVVYWLCFQRITRTAPAVEVIEARSLLVGFGLMFLVQNVANLIWGADYRGYSFLAEPLEFGGVRLMANRLTVFAFAVGASLENRVCEYVDHLHEHFVEPVRIRNARYLAPTAPGYSITMKPESLDRYEFPSGAAWRG